MFGKGNDEIAWGLLAAAAAAGAAFTARKGLELGWKAVRDRDPPDNPVKRGVGWVDALVWGGVIGLAGGLSRIIARRGAAAAWRKTKGPLPSSG